MCLSHAPHPVQRAVPSTSNKSAREARRSRSPAVIIHRVQHPIKPYPKHAQSIAKGPGWCAPFSKRRVHAPATVTPVGTSTVSKQAAYWAVKQQSPAQSQSLDQHWCLHSECLDSTEYFTSAKDLRAHIKVVHSTKRVGKGTQTNMCKEKPSKRSASATKASNVKNGAGVVRALADTSNEKEQTLQKPFRRTVVQSKALDACAAATNLSSQNTHPTTQRFRQMRKKHVQSTL